MNKEKRSYLDSVHIHGRIWCIAALLVMLLVPTLMCFHLKVWPDTSVIMKAFASIAIIYYPTAVVEVVAYAPLLGAGGTYLSFLSGNISNLKLPCALNSMENANVRGNSEEGEIISTISIGTSAIITTIVIAVSVLAFAFNPKFTELIQSETLAPAFKQVTYAIFGALAATYFAKHWKISIFPILAVSLVLVFAGTIQIGILIFVGVAISLIGAEVMYKLKWV